MSCWSIYAAVATGSGEQDLLNKLSAAKIYSANCSRTSNGVPRRVLFLGAECDSGKVADIRPWHDGLATCKLRVALTNLKSTWAGPRSQAGVVRRARRMEGEGTRFNTSSPSRYCTCATRTQSFCDPEDRLEGQPRQHGVSVGRSCAAPELASCALVALASRLVDRPLYYAGACQVNGTQQLGGFFIKL